MKNKRWMVVFLFLMMVGCSGGSGELKGFLPSSNDVQGITKEGRPQVYKGKKLFDYINGGAELFYEYGFEQACVQRYQTPAGEVTAEIYQMDLSVNAYGIYTFDTQGEHPPIGQDATYERGLVTFWKGTYFVRIFSEHEDLKETVLVLGRAIAQKIPQAGERPDILAFLPPRGVTGNTSLYFRGMIALNNADFLSHQNVLSLGEGVEGITFHYTLQAQPLRVILVRYESSAQAEGAFQSLLASDVIKEGTMNNGIFLGKGRRGYGGATVVGALVFLVLDGTEPKTVTRALRSLSLAQGGSQG